MLTYETERGPVKVVVDISPKQVRLSDEPKVVVTIDAAEGIDVQMPAFGTGMEAFQILDFKEPLPTTANGRRVAQQIYVLEPMDSGTQSIDSISVKFRDEDGQPHTIETEPIDIEVSTMLSGEAPSLDDLRPVKPPVELIVPPFPWFSWLAGITVVVLSLLGFRRWRNRTRPQQAVVIPPHVVAQQALQELRKKNLAESDVKEFYVELTAIVRQYVESTTGVSAPEQTTDEFLREIAHHPKFTTQERARFESFLESADLVKYAAYLPDPDDIEAGFDRAAAFVASSQQSGDSAAAAVAQELSA